MAQTQTAADTTRPDAESADQLASDMVTLARRAFGAFKAGNMADLATKARSLADTLESRGFGKVLLKALRSQHEDNRVAARRHLAGINWIALCAVRVSDQMRTELDVGTFRAIEELTARVSAADLVEVKVQKELSFLMGSVVRELGPRGAAMREELDKLLKQIHAVPDSHIENAPVWAFGDWELLTGGVPRLLVSVRLAKARNLAGWLERNRKRLEREAVATQQREIAARAGKRRNRPKRQKLPPKPRRSQEEILAAMPLGKPNPQGFGQTERGKVVPGAGTPRTKRKK